MINLLVAYRGIVFSVLVAASFANSVRFLPDWGVLLSFLILQISLSRGIYAYLNGGRMLTLLGGVVSAKADPESRSVMAGIIFAVYVAIFFV
ncbi:hypothetical protein [Pseudomonas flexibilis]|uniref:hypothetical protein n=1 Tax=Pseudomonas flexibilis TaxID=706570 RepID=UPI00111394F6|nr:hypothetical protein [Pseudomonas flexibilis]